MLVLVFISVSLRFYQEYGSSKAVMKLSEFVRCPVKVQRCADRVVQTELLVQVDQRDVPGDIVIFEPGNLFPGDVRLLTSKHLVISQSSLTGEFGTTEKTFDIREDQSTPLLDLKNICLMENLLKRSLHSKEEEEEEEEICNGLTNQRYMHGS
ncbi:Magnesium-transporting ATPase, P-type 1 [Camellia lanceoleosa]|uniref:Magnesium-transporting ATPase, P-type 1 n=1 Tax=Camellia lanceoleosa TaxID=1840588 RepID=A0ACC0HT79_9ERIC|nr:Magnesium-transporting ATPase, P-type 1 [Camellia lanceoleosa]